MTDIFVWLETQNTNKNVFVVYLKMLQEVDWKRCFLLRIGFDQKGGIKICMGEEAIF